MYYLKCNKCGHFNEIKTEYLTFCSNCGTKLENNFPDWKRKNPDKSFEEHQQIFCTTENVEPIPALRANKSRGLKYWVGFILAFTIFYAIGQLGGEKITGIFRKPVFDKAMMEIANEINKTCPIMVDQVTRLDNSIALPDKVFQYNYTVINVVKDSINLDELQKFIEPRIINDVKTNPGMKFIRDRLVTVNYSYRDMTGVHLFVISVKPEQYQ
jgi:hypothetical protein